MMVVRFLLVASGTLCVALGLVGIFVPVLPTTPLLLLAAFLYARSSERFHRWLLNTHWFGQYIHNYRNRRGILLRDKILTLSVLWLTLGSTVLFAEPAWWVILILAAVGIGVTVHVIQIATLRPAAPTDTRPALRSTEET